METLQQLDRCVSASLRPWDQRKRNKPSPAPPLHSTSRHDGNCSSLLGSQPKLCPDRAPRGLEELLILACIAPQWAGLFIIFLNLGENRGVLWGFAMFSSF